MADQQQIKEKEKVEASQVYLLMTKDYRISRNIRASWFFNHLNSVLHYSPKTNLADFTDELEIVSITSPVPLKGKADNYEYVLKPSSIVTFLSHRYRLVICLDLSPSIVTGDVDSTHVLLDDVYHALCNSLRGVVRPFYVPDSKLLFSPQLYVTVIAHTPLINYKSTQVLLHGCQVTFNNVDRVLKNIHVQLEAFENFVAGSFSEIVNLDPDTEINGGKLTGGLFDDIVERSDSPKFESQIMTADIGFVSLLRYGILALQLLPADTSAGLLVITDGIIGLPDLNHFESLMTQLRNHTIACSFVQVGGGKKRNYGLGKVPYMELMQFIATATFGAFLIKTPKLDPDPHFGMNVYHRAFFTWNFQKGLEGFKIDNLKHHSFEQLDEDLAFLHRATNKSRKRQLWASPVMTKKHIEKNLHTVVSSLISVRLREGYTIKDVAITKGDSLIEVHMVLPWRDNVRIEYLAISPWPITHTKRHTRVEVTIEGSYDFLHDVTCPMKKPLKSSYRTEIVKKFWQTLQGISETDQLMVHIQNFATNPVYYNIHESIKNGVPLFYLPPNSNNPVVSIQHSNKDNALSQFATYWRPILLLDINIWQKWMHTHRIGLVLEHDTPLGKHLHIPNSSGRFHGILCRQALTSLNVLLRDWSSFVLMENHSYIKLIFCEPDKPPSSFYLLRVTSKPPCVVLRLAFIGGTPGAERLQIVKDLRERILALMFPERGVPKEHSGKKATRRLSQSAADTSQVTKPPLQRTWSEIPCCVVMAKPIEKILIRYESMPHDFMTLEFCLKPRSRHHDYSPVSVKRVAASMLTTLSCYLHHHRWVWSVQHGASMPISMQALSRILSTLTKLRLQEGFHFASANSGIVNMVLEVDVKHPDAEEDIAPCLMQYILFPPHMTTTRESASEDELDMETAEADGELQLITECWVEPQYGAVINSTPERKHFNHLSHKSLHKEIFPIDLECVSSMITFEHLNQMCQSLTVPSPSTFRHQSNGCTVFPTSSPSDQNIQHVPFAFNTVQLLPKCLQVEILVSTYIQDIKFGAQTRRGTLVDGCDVREQTERMSDVHTPCDILFSLVLEQMEDKHDREVHLSDDECMEFIKVLSKRPRDLNVNPLPINVASAKDDEEAAGKVLDREVSFESTTTDNTWSRSEEPYMLSCSSSLASILAKRTLSEEAYTQHAFERQDTNASDTFSHSSSMQQLSENLRAVGHQDEQVSHHEMVPRWRCFVKSLSSTHVMLTFLPASYEDLKLLVCGDVDSVQEKLDRSEDQPIMFQVSQGQLSVVTQEKVDEKSQGEKQMITQEMEINDTDKSSQPKIAEEAKEESNKESLTLPIYVYDCPLNNITEQLVNRWTFQATPDIFHDLRFDHASMTEQQDNDQKNVTETKDKDLVEEADMKITGEGDESSKVTFEPMSPSSVKSGDGRATGRSGERTDSEGEKEKWRRKSSVQDSLFAGQEDLRDHCYALTEAFFSSFVTGIYQSLKNEQNIESQDVEAAINNICEEASPLEIDIMHFIQSLCGHFNPLIERQNIQQMLHDDLAKTGTKLLEEVVQSQEQDVVADGNQPDASDQKPTFTNFLSGLHQLPYTSLMLPLTRLQQQVSCCESVQGLHSSIKNKFMKIINTFFLPVPSNPDFYFFFPQGQQRVRDNSRDFKDDSEDNAKDHKIGDATGGEESELFLSDYEHAGDLQAEGQGHDIDMESLSSLMDDDLDSLGLDENEENMSPLFVHLTCSVRISNNAMKSIGVHDLPTCLADLHCCLEELVSSEEVDLSSLHITLDIICLTLPADVEMPEGSRPRFDRMTSFQSHVSEASDHMGDQDEATSFFMSEGGKDIVTNPLTNLPKAQQEAVKSCREQIQWLLRDEIACAMRNIFPVTVSTLDTVAQHVQTASDTVNCIVERVPLQFVFGSDHSFARYVEEFERLDLPGYHLNKEGSYYYMVLDHNLATTIAHARAMNAAPGSAFKDFNESTNIGELSPLSNGHSLPNLNQEDVVFHNESSKNTQDVPVEERSVIGSDGITKPEANIEGEDIKISVTRPSPVKEKPTPATSNDQISPEKSGSEKCLLSLESESHASAVDNGGHDSSAQGQGQDERMRLTYGYNEKVQQLRMRHKSGESSINEAMAKLEETRKSNEESKNNGSNVRESVSDQLLISISRLNSSITQSQLSPIPASLSDTDAHSPDPSSKDVAAQLRKTQSSASFEKYKLSHDSQARKGEQGATPMSGQGTPGRHHSGPQTPVRSRHQSGPQTPQSCFFSTSSRSSYGEEGYEAGSSDSDSEGVMMSFNELQLQREHLPNFWLIMRLSHEIVHVFFHTRDKGEGETEEIISQKNIFNQVISHISKTCRIVNQLLLLKDLNENRICNKLLVPEADEDINWKQDRGNMMNRRRMVHDSESSESDSDSPQRDYLAASMKFMPGYFACDCVWKIHFPLHPRLKTSPVGRSSLSRGMQALRLVLNKFAVSDRKNMFVIKESSSNVFYLRLDESMCEVQGLRDGQSVSEILIGQARPEEDLSLNASLNMSSASLFKRQIQERDDDTLIANRRLSVGDRDLDSISVTSRKRVEESIVLAAHGIGQVGVEISHDLVQLLQKRLDDAVLDILTVTLARNPMCKLTVEDIQYIQPPHEAPKEVVRLTIPASAMLQQFALAYYLRQNLQQFLHPPKYFDNKPEHVFQDYTQTPVAPIPDNDVYVYNRPQQAGGKGIACIHMSLVDGRGNPIQLISCHKPSSYAYKDPVDSSMFDAVTATSRYPVRNSSPKPEDTDSSPAPEDIDSGPACLVQFNIWERGDVDMAQLSDRLVAAMRHAICDTVMEFRLLTAPLCESPKYYEHGIDSPMHSAPPSPQVSISTDPKSALPTIPIKPVKEVGVPSPSVKTPKEKTAFQTFVSEAFGKAKSSLGTPTNKDAPKNLQQTWQQLEGERRKTQELRQKVALYECGEKGVLQTTYSQTMLAWCTYCTSIGVPSVNKIMGKMKSRFSVDYVLREFQSRLGTVCSDVTPKVFKLMDNEGLWLPHSFTKHHTGIMTEELVICEIRIDKTAGQGDSDSQMTSFKSEDGKRADVVRTRLPGRSNVYCVVGRNFSQWRESIDIDELDPAADQSTASNLKTLKSYQKFLPLEVGVDRQSNQMLISGSSSPLPPECAADRTFVPRQRLLFMTIKDTKFELYLYNWSTDMANKLEKMFHKLIQWHNARSHLLSTIISQKMGLFRHTIFGELPPDPITQEPNPYIQSTSEIELLVKYSTPPPDAQFRSRSGSILRSAPHIHPAVLTFETMFQNVKPRHVMQRCSYSSSRDPVQRHGRQMLDIKNMQRKESDKRMKLEELYMIWQQRMGHAPMSITNEMIQQYLPEEDVLDLLKKSSRLIHNVATPLLFSPQWRKKVVSNPEESVKPQSSATSQASDSKPRSRHSSGASVRSLRADSIDSKKRLSEVEPLEMKMTSPPKQEEAWHVDLRYSFIQQYIQYLQTLSFLEVRTRPSSLKRGSGRSSSSDANTRPSSSSDPYKSKPQYMYLQKTLPGGIMLIEVGFREVYFCVRLFAFECSRVPIGRNVNSQLSLIFTDECDKFKDLTHAHSFAHDFHLRTIQSYITDGPLVFNKGYHLIGFLQDFIRHYPYAPSFSRNYIYQGSLTIPSSSNASHQLYDYMLKHDKMYNMKAVRMKPTVSAPDLDTDHEYALVTQSLKKTGQIDDTDSFKKNGDDYAVGLVVCHDTSANGSEVNKMTLRLRYYVILTSRKKVFPKLKLEKKLRMFKTSATKVYPATGLLMATSEGSLVHEVESLESSTLSTSEEDSPAFPGSHHMTSRQESVNYLGYSNMHQTPIYNLLMQEAQGAGSKPFSVSGLRGPAHTAQDLTDIRRPSIYNLRSYNLKARHKIEQMVESARALCRRDTLWQRMLLGDLKVAEEESRGRKRRMTSDNEDKGSGFSKLTFTEFQDLLDVVTRVPLDKVDPQLSALQTMSVAWYQSLIKVLTTRYSESHRFFTSNDGLVKYVVILNPNYLDTFMMLGVDLLSNKTELCAVYREESTADVEHSLDAPSLPALAMQNCIEGFVNTCCYHLWTGLI